MALARPAASPKDRLSIVSFTSSSSTIVTFPTGTVTGEVAVPLNSEKVNISEPSVTSSVRIATLAVCTPAVLAAQVSVPPTSV